jgi:ubiquinone/menaquinone biosynthesis C-methylase UbiE
MSNSRNIYDITYSNFKTNVLAEIRCEIYGDDIGQNSWSTANEYKQFYTWLELDPILKVLDIACGSGGPALFMARLGGCAVTGLDNNLNAITIANEMARIQELDSSVLFQEGDARIPLPFDDGLFDVVICIDAIIHLPDRLLALKDWYRVLGAAGRILYTDTTVVTGLVSHEEIAIRSTFSYFLFSPPGENEQLIQKARFKVME